MAGVNEGQVRADLKAVGRDQEYIDKVAPHKVHKGNRPTNTILLKCINPRNLGSLIAAYEHKIFVQGIMLHICSFGQWGVELDKGLAAEIYSELNRVTLLNNMIVQRPAYWNFIYQQNKRTL